MGWSRNDRYDDGYGSRWAPYVSVGAKKNKAVKLAARIAKKQKREPSPVAAAGRKMAKSFWGLAWCDNLEAYRDYANRLPRGATYLRNGSVVDLVIHPKRVDAIVAGSVPYTITIEIQPLKPARWKTIREDCSASIDSLLDLLAGKLSDGVMKRLTDQKNGLFPAPAEIKMRCNCPDGSSCCKHLAAVMYGIGARLDIQPELLFVLRGVDHSELVAQAIASGNLERELADTASPTLDNNDLESIFGIQLDSAKMPPPESKPANRKRAIQKKTSSPKTRGKVSKKLPKRKPAKRQPMKQKTAARKPVKKKK